MKLDLKQVIGEVFPDTAHLYEDLRWRRMTDRGIRRFRKLKQSKN